MIPRPMMWHWTVYPAVVMMAVLLGLFVLQDLLRCEDLECVEYEEVLDTRE